MMRSILLLLTFSLSLPTFAEKKILLPFGNQDYRKSGYNSLKYPNSDAVKMANYWKTQGFEANVVKDISYSEFKSKIEELRTLDTEDTVILYFSGHGERHISGGKIIKQLIVSDSFHDEEGTLKNYIDMAWVERMLMRCPARKIVVILAACKSGPYQLPDNLKGRPGDVPSQFIVASAASDDGESFEHPDFEGDILTHFLLEEFRDTSEPNKTFYTSFKNAARKTIEAVKSRSNLKTQLPTIKNLEVGVGIDPIFVNENRTLGSSKETIIAMAEQPNSKNLVQQGFTVSIDGVQMNSKGSLVFSGGGVKRIEIYDESNKLLHSRLSKFEDGRLYFLPNIFGEIHPNSAGFSLSQLHFDGGSFLGIGLEYSHRKNDWSYFASVSQFRGETSIEGWGTKQPISNFGYLSSVGAQFRYPLITFLWSDLGFTASAALSHLYVKREGPASERVE